jgi:hypothetical protein
MMAGPADTKTYIDFSLPRSTTGILGWLTRGACRQFFDRCASHGLELTTLYDFLVVRQITPSNPAHSVRGPKYVVKKGETPVWNREDAKTPLDSIPKDSVSGLRDLALIAAMF